MCNFQVTFLFHKFRLIEIMSILNWDYQNPTRIVFGRGQIAKLSSLIPKEKKVLVCYGYGSIKRNGVYEQVMNALQGYDITEFSGIEANPDFDTLMKAVAILKEKGPEDFFILAVGGGSICDGCKFISLAALYEGEHPYEDILMTGGAGCTRAVPIGVVLTLPATGSESNYGCVISYRAKHGKYSMYSTETFPKFAILDPETTYSLPTKQTANGVVDAFVHVCEQYVVDCRHADVQDRYSEALLKVLIDNGREVKTSPNSYEVRANIMWAANQALNHWIDRGVRVDWATHKIGHELTAFLGLDHAQTLACVQRRVYEFKFEAKKQKLAQMAERVFDVKEGSVEEKARKCIELIEEFYQEMGVPTRISEYNCSQDKAWIDEVHAKFTAGNFRFGEDADIDADVAREIILKSY